MVRIMITRRARRKEGMTTMITKGTITDPRVKVAAVTMSCTRSLRGYPDKRAVGTTTMATTLSTTMMTTTRRKWKFHHQVQKLVTNSAGDVPNKCVKLSPRSFAATIATQSHGMLIVNHSNQSIK